MKFIVITHVLHKKRGDSFYAYAPYVREMNLWFGHIAQVIVVAPLNTSRPGAIDQAYQQEHITFRSVPAFHFANLPSALQALWQIAVCFWSIFIAMQSADHIHLRCPGNMGLLGCLAQIAFPGKMKTAKYAGNWNPASRQPLSYRLQKAILRNTFLTRNMQVLVYGDWPGATHNIRRSFTATYSENEKEETPPRTLNLESTVGLMFAGSLSPGKNPLLVVQTCHQLLRNGINTTLDIYGDGPERSTLEDYIQRHKLQDHIKLNGARDANTVKRAYQKAHFLILASQSEGWPKVVAEAMFWGCVPITTAVSCVPWMLGDGKRGVVVDCDPNATVDAILSLIHTPEAYQEMSQKAMDWSRQYTLERFEEEIAKLLQ